MSFWKPVHGFWNWIPSPLFVLILAEWPGPPLFSWTQTAFLWLWEESKFNCCDNKRTKPVMINSHMKSCMKNIQLQLSSGEKSFPNILTERRKGDNLSVILWDESLCTQTKGREYCCPQRTFGGNWQWKGKKKVCETFTKSLASAKSWSSAPLGALLA